MQTKISEPDLTVMENRGVIVLASDGEVISMGRLQRSTSPTADEAWQRLDLHFETETMRCILRVPTARLPELAQSWDGVVYRYVLPAGNHLWRPTATSEVSPIPPTPIVETFSLPPARGGALAPATPTLRA